MEKQGLKVDTVFTRERLAKRKREDRIALTVSALILILIGMYSFMG